MKFVILCYCRIANRRIIKKVRRKNYYSLCDWIHVSRSDCSDHLFRNLLSIWSKKLIGGWRIRLISAFFDVLQNDFTSIFLKILSSQCETSRHRKHTLRKSKFQKGFEKLLRRKIRFCSENFINPREPAAIFRNHFGVWAILTYISRSIETGIECCINTIWWIIRRHLLCLGLYENVVASVLIRNCNRFLNSQFSNSKPSNGKIGSTNEYKIYL